MNIEQNLHQAQDFAAKLPSPGSLDLEMLDSARKVRAASILRIRAEHSNGRAVGLMLIGAVRADGTYTSRELELGDITVSSSSECRTRVLNLVGEYLAAGAADRPNDQALYMPCEESAETCARADLQSTLAAGLASSGGVITRAARIAIVDLIDRRHPAGSLGAAACLAAFALQSVMEKEPLDASTAVIAGGGTTRSRAVCLSLYNALNAARITRPDSYLSTLSAAVRNPLHCAIAAANSRQALDEDEDGSGRPSCLVQLPDEIADFSVESLIAQQAGLLSVPDDWLPLSKSEWASLFAIWRIAKAASSGERSGWIEDMRFEGALARPRPGDSWEAQYSRMRSDLRPAKLRLGMGTYAEAYADLIRRARAFDPVSDVGSGDLRGMDSRPVHVAVCRLSERFMPRARASGAPHLTATTG